MNIWMTPAEEQAFRGFLAPATGYLEFGCGGSTVAAASMVKGRVVAVDSAPEWLDSVRAGLADANVTAAVTLRHADIGPVSAGGYPSDRSRVADWPRYHSDVWADEPAGAFDLFLVDGRFRVACFAQCVLRGRPDALILFHDYAPRPQYHVVADLAREVFREGDLSGFMRRADFDVTTALDLLERHRIVTG
jgi:predicted O-methyltransferase YrrM